MIFVLFIYFTDFYQLTVLLNLSCDELTINILSYLIVQYTYCCVIIYKNKFGLN